jgi:hypothetical protein
LLAFNVGVELGQVLFVTALLAIAVVVQRATQPYPNISGALRQPLIYGIGIISGYWVMARADTWFY